MLQRLGHAVVTYHAEVLVTRVLEGWTVIHFWPAVNVIAAHQVGVRISRNYRSRQLKPSVVCRSGEGQARAVLGCDEEIRHRLVQFSMYQFRTASYETVMLRRSSTSRKLRVNRRYNHIAQLMTSGRKPVSLICGFHPASAGDSAACYGTATAKRPGMAFCLTRVSRPHQRMRCVQVTTSVLTIRRRTGHRAQLSQVLGFPLPSVSMSTEYLYLTGSSYPLLQGLGRQ